MNKTTYIILGIVAVLAVIAAIYFYNKSKTQTVVVVPPTNPQQTTGWFQLINGLGGVLQNVNWQSIFGNNNIDKQMCGDFGKWNAATQQCEPK